MLLPCCGTRAVAENRRETACRLLHFMLLLRTQLMAELQVFSLSSFYPSHQNPIRLHSHSNHSRYPRCRLSKRPDSLPAQSHRPSVSHRVFFFSGLGWKVSPSRSRLCSNH
ncbi:hypothetical protein PoB_002203300 [Plakobranchus ocellatus]|uniref:Secreted protein n=1 Tax=Plakobranchus ocellatus TaxID=259542 RepID=A0AAV3ZM45_9GAST|nr:hypothetical protein PoB_002203300 [Plakobranchus ocellatus]